MTNGTTYSPKQFALKSGISYDKLRDWRRVGDLKWLGTKGENGHWSYNFTDLVSVAIAQVFISKGIKIEDSFLFAKNTAAPLCKWLFSVPFEDIDKSERRYYVFYNTGKGDKEAERWKLAAWDRRGLSLDEFDFPISHLVDLKALSRALPMEVIKEFHGSVFVEGDDL